MKRCCVTGATGCVGRNLVDALLEDGWEVTVLHRASSDLSRLEGARVQLREVNLYIAESVRWVVPYNTDAIFHCAANTSHWWRDEEEQWKDNVLATRNLVQAALEKGVWRFIFTSTAATLPYQNTHQESALKIPQQYIRTKRLAEMEVHKGMQQGLNTVFLHPCIVIGKYDYNSYSQIFTALANGTLTRAFPGRIAFCHAGDVARAHVTAFNRGVRGENYVLGGTYTTWKEAFDLIADTVGVPRVEVAPRWLLKTVAYWHCVRSMYTGEKPQLTPSLVNLLRDAPDVYEYEKQKAFDDLGYRSRSLEKMVWDCYEWMKKEGR